MTGYETISAELCKSLRNSVLMGGSPENYAERLLIGSFVVTHGTPRCGPRSMRCGSELMQTTTSLLTGEICISRSFATKKESSSIELMVKSQIMWVGLLMGILEILT